MLVSSSAECLKRWRYNGAIITASFGPSFSREAAFRRVGVTSRPILVCFVAAVRGLSLRLRLCREKVGRENDVRRVRRAAGAEKPTGESTGAGGVNYFSRHYPRSVWRDFYPGLVERANSSICLRGEGRGKKKRGKKKEKKHGTRVVRGVYFTGVSMQVPDVLSHSVSPPPPPQRGICLRLTRQLEYPPRRTILSDPEDRLRDSTFHVGPGSRWHTTEQIKGRATARTPSEVVGTSSRQDGIALDSRGREIRSTGRSMGLE